MNRAELIVLSKEERATKERLEQIVDEGKVSFIAVGHALREIKDNPTWYGPQSFESYCEERFGFRKMHTWRLRAASVVADAIEVSHGIPDAERTIRPLTRLLDKKQDEPTGEQRDRIEAAWARACKLAEEEGVTVAGRHAKAAVDEALGITKTISEGRATPMEIVRSAAGKLNEIHADDPGRPEALAFFRRWLDAFEA